MIVLFQAIEHIRSYRREVSHYSREKTKDKQFLDSHLSIAEIWREFLEKNNVDLASENFPICYSSFRNLFRTFKLSFRKPYVDTCGSCDSYTIITKYSKDEQERVDAQKSKLEHIEKADLHYDCMNYDLVVLPKEKNKAKEIAWVLPPLWKF